MQRRNLSHHSLAVKRGNAQGEGLRDRESEQWLRPRNENDTRMTARIRREIRVLVR
jgi:hypothetical protein